MSEMFQSMSEQFRTMASQDTNDDNDDDENEEPTKDGIHSETPASSPGDVKSYYNEYDNMDMNMDALDFSSTYGALSTMIREYKRTGGGRKLDLLPKKVLQRVFDKFEEKQVDLANVQSIPYDAHDVEDCLLLLAKIQNRGAMQGMEEKSFTLRELIEDTLVDRTEKQHLYDIGEFVEVFGSGMSWRLEKISNVIKNDEDDDNTTSTYVYQTVVDQYLTETNIRWPKEALVQIFGFAPFVWQQWACLRLENRLQFKVGSRYDFEKFSILDYTKDLWIAWLKDERNAKFRNLYERVGKSGQEQLLDHLMSPFELMQAVITNKDGEWDLEEAKISIFTYFSFLGSGVLDTLLVSFLQLAMPLILAWYYSSRDGADTVEVGTREILFTVLVYYLAKVNRDVWSSFNTVVGISDQVYSRLQSLRKIVFDNGNDSTAQSLGYIADIFINTGYVCILYLFNIWILFNVSDPFEILGSVVFFEFLVDLDEDFANAYWWDEGKRWIRAGIISQLMQQIIGSEHTLSRKIYLEKYGHRMRCMGMTHDDLVQHFDNAGLPNDETFLGTEEDDYQIGVWTLEERVRYKRRNDSKSARHLLQVHKTDKFFSLLSDAPIFQRHRRIRAWSQWQIILFLMPIPDIVPEDYIPGSKLMLTDKIGNISLKNIRKTPIGLTRKQRFWKNVKDVLTFGTLKQVYGNLRLIKHKPKIFFLTRILHALVLWVSYTIQLLFPILVLLSLIAVYMKVPGTEGAYFYCWIHRGECTFENFWDKGSMPETET